MLIYWLREFSLPAVSNRIELRCQVKQLLSGVTETVEALGDFPLEALPPAEAFVNEMIETSKKLPCPV